MNKRALFLDRDGVINVDRSYVHSIEDFHFIDGIFELCRHAKMIGMSIFIVTNQAGIGRGYYTENQFHDLTQWMLGCFTAEAITIDGVYFCPFHPTHGVGRYKVESQDRKPGPGMILRASKEYNIDLSKSVLVGDRETDIAAAKRAGVGKSVLFSSNQILTLKPDFIVDSLRTVKQILSEI